ncbi:DNA-directed DNA polymerase [Methanococcus maripaludis]|uniref:DNA polymerase n=1 Tax=Methanococcus maripaludis TaxID=39152 RepID=A0A7J9S118_METMI|nr:DNA-directed DNA polymerase [Methanococcus maripaludis]MBB6067989.1 DNA polymerase I [Methanococcus maripaludis]
MESLIDLDYNSDDLCIYLYLINSIIKEKDFKPYFYVNSTDKEQILEFLKDYEKKHKLNSEISKMIENIETVKKIVFDENYQEKELSKVTVKYPNNVKTVREILMEFERLYEYDIPFVRRYLIDNSVIPTSTWDFDNNKKIDNKIPDFKTVSFDIEVYCNKEPNPKKDPIIMASFSSKDFNTVVSTKKFDHEKLEYVKDEKELIKRIIEILKDYDIIYTYNGDNFDFPYLKKRAESFGLELKLGKNDEKIKITKGGMNSKSYIPGRVHIDLYPIARRLLNLTKYRLENVTEALFDVKKVDVGHENIPKMWDNLDETLVEYSHQDAYYTQRIGEQFLPLEIMFSRVVNQSLYDINRMSSSQMVEYLLLKNSYKMGVIAPNRPSGKEYQKRIRSSYEGGYVKEPLKGIHEDIVSMDFLSLYPSIIMSHNLSPETIDCTCCSDEENGENEEILGHKFCKKSIGIIPKTLMDLINRRKKVKKVLREKAEKGEFDEEYQILDYEQRSIKVLANSHYGYLAFPMARWYSRDCAEITTHLGRQYIQKTIEEAENFGFKVIYADTDGFYSKWADDKEKLSKDELLEKTREFLKNINNTLPGEMELEFEGYFKRGIFVTKKKYALIDENEKITVKGLEVVRRDWSNVSKNTQKNVLNALLKEGSVENAKKVIQDTIKELKDGKVNNEDLLIHTQLTKRIEDYKTTAPHVEVAKKILKSGNRVNVGDVISYIITSGNKSISERAEILENAKNYDTNYYIENQILPPVIRLMEALGITKDELKDSKKQYTLHHFLK